MNPVQTKNPAQTKPAKTAAPKSPAPQKGHARRASDKLKPVMNRILSAESITKTLLT